MTTTKRPDIASQRLSTAEIEGNFRDLHPQFSDYEARVAADRCYFCYDAPCVRQCPTEIDIPGFIQSIRSGNIVGSARTILDANIMGGMCARVCPTETLCEQACVRNTAEDQPVQIGRLQRYATDPIINDDIQLFERQPDGGKRVAVVGAGPAGLACAHALSRRGHRVVVLERHDKPGGLNEYGIAAYKTVDEFAAREVDYILGLGGMELQMGQALGRDFTLDDLRRDYDAVFLAIGLGDTNTLGLDQETGTGMLDAVRYIADLRQAQDKGQLPVGRRVVVIGGGMTAIDVAVQSRYLGAEEVTIVYRRDKVRMSASVWEQELAQTKGVKIVCQARPRRLLVENDAVNGVEFERTRVTDSGSIEDTGETFQLAADSVFKAIGQKLMTVDLEQAFVATGMKNGRVSVDAEMHTGIKGVWAGGDCVSAGQDLTVSAVAHGKTAAASIDHYLTQA